MCARTAHVTENWKTESQATFLYDGWNLVYELADLQNGSQTEKAYVWGKDLSGSLQGAGGVGGLLMATHAQKAVFYPAMDGNGNVMGYYTASTGASVAEFEYGAFGELIRTTGSKAGEFNFRFSTKYQDAETDLLYYGFRYYDSQTGRWLSRDPIGENGGPNLYGMVFNDPMNYWDYLGMFPIIEIGTWKKELISKRYTGEWEQSLIKLIELTDVTDECEVICTNGMVPVRVDQVEFYGVVKADVGFRAEAEFLWEYDLRKMQSEIFVTPVIEIDARDPISFEILERYTGEYYLTCAYQFEVDLVKRELENIRKNKGALEKQLNGLIDKANAWVNQTVDQLEQVADTFGNRKRRKIND